MTETEVLNRAINLLSSSHYTYPLKVLCTLREELPKLRAQALWLGHLERMEPDPWGTFAESFIEDHPEAAKLLEMCDD